MCSECGGAFKSSHSRLARSTGDSGYGAPHSPPTTHSDASSLTTSRSTKSSSTITPHSTSSSRPPLLTTTTTTTTTTTHKPILNSPGHAISLRHLSLEPAAPGNKPSHSSSPSASHIVPSTTTHQIQTTDHLKSPKSLSKSATSTKDRRENVVKGYEDAKKSSTATIVIVGEDVSSETGYNNRSAFEHVPQASQDSGDYEGSLELQVSQLYDM